MSQRQLASSIKPANEQPNMFQQPFEPGSANEGDRWIDTSTDTEFFYHDGDWVEITPGAINEESDPIFSSTRMGTLNIPDPDLEATQLVTGMTTAGGICVTPLYVSDEVGIPAYNVERISGGFKIKVNAPAGNGNSWQFYWWVPRLNIA